MSAGDRRERGALEAEVLACLAATDGPMTARQVNTAIVSSLAYTTVMTTLGRLHEKGALVRELTGRAYVYRLTGDSLAIDAAVTARRMHKALNAGSDRSVALNRFVSELEPEDERFLAELLRQLSDEPPPAGVS